MDAATTSFPPADDSGAWIDALPFADAGRARERVAAIWQSGAPADLLQLLRERLAVELAHLDDADAALDNLSRFVAASRSPTSLLALFERDPDSLPALLQVFATSQALADQLISDPESFDLLRASDGQPAPRRFLVDELIAELQAIDSPSRAAVAIRKFTSREILRIAYGEFVRGMTPDMVGRQLAYVADAVLEAALDFAVGYLADRHGLPSRIDASVPTFSVIALGGLGGEELSYGTPLRIVVVCDQIDRRNASHVAFYDGVVDELIALVCDDSQPLGIDIDLREQPRIGSARAFGVDEAVEYYESTNRIWQRMNFLKARVAAGSNSLGATFLGRLQPWIYRAFMNRAELGEIRALRHKLERRAERSDSPGDDVRNDPGGRRDVEMAIQFLQLLHGNELSSVQVANTHDAIDALQQAGCVTHQEATLLSGNYARLCRLQHQHSVMFQLGSSRLPADRKLRRRLAWRLGLRTADGQRGDLERFEDSLRETFRLNRRIINHLMVDTPHGDEEPPIETELLLDPSPDPALAQTTLSRYGLPDPARAMADLAVLGTESVSFLSQPRCRHFLAILAPTLLNEIAQTPAPDKTLASLVEVTESLGAKAVLWELFRTNPPTMKLMVRLCAAAPYLSGILVNHPGMIDELIDSLLMDALPSANRLDAQSIELCRAAEDLGPILKSFKNCAHLTVGVRDILGRDSIESTHRALSDTAEACLRRVVEHEQARLASRFGDPMTAAGEPAHLVIVALGKLGGREPNYHSTLDVVFLYTDDGETHRRVGGPRATTTNKHFFHQLAQNVLGRVYAYGPLYELDSRLRISRGEETLCASVDAFVRRFRHGIAPLWERMALCKARCVVGPRPLRPRIDASLVDLVRGSTWHDRMSEEIRDLRQRIEEASTSTNLKRGAGGTLDVEMIAQMLTLKNASNPDLDIRTSTTESLQALADAGCLDEEQALTLIGNYRVLRRIEANLRLMDTPERHRLPDEAEAMRDLAFLMNERDPAMILAQCQQAQRTNRRIFDELTGRRDG